MDQTKNQAINDQGVEKTQDVMPTSESSVVEPQIDQSVEDTNVEESESSSSAKELEDAERKPTRLERNLGKKLQENKALKERINQLEGKADDVYDFLGVKPKADEMENLFTEEELATGEISNPRDFQNRIAQMVEQRATKKVEEVLSGRERASKYRETVETHTKELDDLLTEMPELQDEETARAFVETYEDINYLGDRFIGRVSPKKIAERMFGTAKRIADRKTTEVAKQVAQMKDDQAIVSGADISRSSGGLTDLYNKAIETGTDDDWAKYFKAKNSK